MRDRRRKAQNKASLAYTQLCDGEPIRKIRKARCASQSNAMDGYWILRAPAGGRSLPAFALRILPHRQTLSCFRDEISDSLRLGRNFSRAAEALFVTPSGLSVLIRELKSRVGFRMFDRTTRHVDLTSHGRELLAVIQRSLTELDGAIANIARSARGAHQQISLGTTPLVAANILPPAMREFRKQRPDIQFQLFDAELPALIKMVETGQLDMSLGIFKPMAAVRRERFFRFSLMVVRASKDDIPPRRTMTWHALNGETLISLSSGHPHQQLIDRHLAQAGVRVRICSVVNPLDTQIALVEAEEGIAMILSLGMPACRNRKVVLSQLTNPVVCFDFQLVHRVHKYFIQNRERFRKSLNMKCSGWNPISEQPIVSLTKITGRHHDHRSDSTAITRVRVARWTPLWSTTRTRPVNSISIVSLRFLCRGVNRGTGESSSGSNVGLAI